MPIIRRYVDPTIPGQLSRESLQVNQNGQLEFMLSFLPGVPSKVFLSLNGILQLYSTDYTVVASILTWNNTPQLETTDSLEVWYFG